jgi:hypothetical protein
VKPPRKGEILTHIIMGIGQSEVGGGRFFFVMYYLLLSYDPGDHP